MNIYTKGRIFTPFKKLQVAQKFPLLAWLSSSPTSLPYARFLILNPPIPLTKLLNLWQSKTYSSCIIRLYLGLCSRRCFLGFVWFESKVLWVFLGCSCNSPPPFFLPWNKAGRISSFWRIRFCFLCVLCLFTY